MIIKFPYLDDPNFENMVDVDIFDFGLMDLPWVREVVLPWVESGGKLVSINKVSEKFRIAYPRGVDLYYLDDRDRVNPCIVQRGENGILGRIEYKDRELFSIYMRNDQQEKSTFSEFSNSHLLPFASALLRSGFEIESGISAHEIAILKTHD